MWQRTGEYENPLAGMNQHIVFLEYNSTRDTHQENSIKLKNHAKEFYILK